MDKLRGLFYDVVKSNSDTDLVGFYVDAYKKVAIGGYRRIYGNGDCLVRVRSNQINMGTIAGDRGVYNYLSSSFDTNWHGLPGSELQGGGREMVGVDEAHEKFENVFAKVNGYYRVLVNPKVICKWIEDRTVNSGMDNKKVNIQVFDSVSADGQFPGRLGTFEGHNVIELRRKGEVIPGFIDDKSSLVKSYNLKQGQVYIVQNIGVVEGRNLVKVLRPFKRGIRLAIQTFKNGSLLPGQPRYSVLEEDNNGIGSNDVLDLPFIEGQEGNFTGAPIMHFDLDTLYRALKPMTMFRVAEVFFKDFNTGVLIAAILEKDDQPMIDAIVGPTTPYSSGKVYTI